MSARSNPLTGKFILVLVICLGFAAGEYACAQSKRDKKQWKELKKKEFNYIKNFRFRAAANLFKQNKKKFGTPLYRHFCKVRAGANRRIDSTFQSLINWINNESSKIAEFKMSGLEMKPVEADRTEYKMSNGTVTMPKKWRDLDSPAELLDFVKEKKLSAKDKFGFGTLLMHAGDTSNANRLLASAYQDNQNLQTAISKYMAMLDERRMPEDGYEVASNGSNLVPAGNAKGSGNRGAVGRAGRGNRNNRGGNAGARNANQNNNGKISDKDLRMRKKHWQHIMELGQKWTPNGALTVTRNGAIQNGGRAWGNGWTIKSMHYKVECTISEKAAGEVALLMELLYYNYAQAFKLPYTKLPQKRMTVKIPKNWDQFQQVRNTRRGVRGWFSPSNGVLCIFYQFKNDQWNTAKVIMHEGGHQFVHFAFSGRPPNWLNEAVAEYFRAAHFAVGGVGDTCGFARAGAQCPYTKKKPFQLHFGGILRKRLQRAKSKLSKYSLKKLLREKRPAPGYDIGWSFVHAMAYAKRGKYSKYLKKFIRWFQTNSLGNRDMVDLFNEIFDKPTIAEVEQAWKEYVKNLSPAHAFPN